MENNMGKTVSAGNPYLESLRKRVGLPEGMSQEEIFAFECSFSPAALVQRTSEEWETKRKHLAALNELPEDAKWLDIMKAKVEYGRVVSAKGLGLPENATWTEISQAVERKQTAEGGKTQDETIQVGSNIGLPGSKISWKNILSKMEALGIKI